MRVQSYAIMVCGLLISGWTTAHLYRYFFDVNVPHLELRGIVADAQYAGNVPVEVVATKSGYMSLALDNQPVVTDLYIKAGQAHRIMVPTEHSADGRHMLHCSMYDTTYARNKGACSCSLMVDNKPLQVAAVRNDELQVLQGRTLHVQFQVNKTIKDARVHALSKSYPCFAATRDGLLYECFIPIDCQERPHAHQVAIEVVDHVGNKAHLEQGFQVVAYAFKQQRLAVDPEKLAHERACGRTLAQLEQALAQLVTQSPQEKLWQGAFCTPIDIERITCEYGTIRTTQERGRYMHQALDIINKPKSVVWATQRGVVVVKDRFDMSGNTVVLDHGCGLLSLFYHLDDFADIELGQTVAQGNPLGTLGMTGYATGYHLHWEMRLNNVPVDPLQWTQDTF